MTTTAAQLYNAIGAVCPIVSVSLKNASDKTTWSVQFAEQATPQQMAAAQAAIASFDPAADNRSKAEKIAAEEVASPVSQRFLREALLYVAEKYPEIKSSPGYQKIAAAEAKIAVLRSQP